MLSQEQIYEQKRKLLYILLLCECNERLYDGIRFLSEQAKINKSQLISHLDKHRMVDKMPEGTIFFDIAAEIYNHTENNPSLLLLAEDYYTENYPDIIKYIERIEKKQPDLYEIANEIADKSLRPLNDDYIIDPKPVAYLFLFYCSDYLNRCGLLDIIHKDTFRITVEFMAYDESVDLICLRSNYDVGGDIFESKQYKKWLEKTKQCLCEYLSEELRKRVDFENMGAALIDLFLPVPNDFDIHGKLSAESYMAAWVTRHVIVKHCGSLKWLESLIGGDIPRDIKYIPDIDYIIDTYYKIAVSTESYRLGKKTQCAISKIYLSREFKTNPVDDINNMAFMFYLDIMMTMLKGQLMEYYKNFSWEQISSKPLITRYQNNISKLQDRVIELSSKLEEQLEENASLQSQLIKNSDSVTRPYIEENISLMKKLEEKEEENSKLREKIRSMEELMALQAVEETEEETTDSVNLELLKTKRYLFVGYDVPVMKELKKQFPRSLFMESETYNLTGINVDAVVMLIRNMSHSMYYKVISSKTLMDLPIVRVNTRNINTIYKEMKNVLNCIVD